MLGGVERDKSAGTWQIEGLLYNSLRQIWGRHVINTRYNTNVYVPVSLVLNS